MAFSNALLRRTIAVLTNVESVTCAPNLTLWPRFLASNEQHTLATAALQKLDRLETRRARRRMDEYQLNIASSSNSTKLASHHQCFFPDNYYGFQEGHYDGVIHHFREMHLNSWLEDEIPGLDAILKRLYALCPTQDTQTHLLHLASYGEILPHVDNISASGSWIMGVSLGSERILRMEGPGGENDTFEVSLPSGSVYLQRDSMRFQYKHSILKSELLEGTDPRTGQRLSIIIRDLPPSSAEPDL